MFPTERFRSAGVWLAGLAYAVLACGLTWPLPRYFQTRLLGETSGDLGVYIWNLWIFRHELVEHGHLPVSTDHVFAYTDGLDFALHNYTPLAGLLSVPLMDWLGIVGTFNVIVITFMVLSGLGVFLLARRLGLGSASAWAAGAVFMASPVLTARETEHLSLITAAPLPLFIWALLRTLDTKSVRDAALVGLLVALATYSDAYYGIYCAIAGTFIVAWRFLRVAWRDTRRSAVTWLVDSVIALVGLVIAWRVLTGATAIFLANVRIGLQTLYTPVLALTLLLGLRAWLVRRPTFALHDPDHVLGTLVRRALLSVAVCLALLMPLIIGIGYRVVEDRLPELVIRWRTSPAGVDLLGYLLPNPLHPAFGSYTRSWFATNEGFPEFVASFSIVALVVIAAGAAVRVLPGMWVAFTALFALLSLGPFVHVAGVNTYVPGPWAILRYVPIFEMARSPSRFAIVTALGLSLLFAFALTGIGRRLAALNVGPTSRAGIAAAVVLAMTLELTPAPRTLYSAEVPEVYQIIQATNDETGKVLELPTGVRDGTSMLGKFDPATQFFQTRHHRPIVGGYASRVSTWRKRENRRSSVLRAIFELSEGGVPSPDLIKAARQARNGFFRRSCVRFVVVNKRHASDALRAFANDVLKLRLIHDDGGYQLLTPVDPPPCEPRRRRGHVPKGERARAVPAAITPQ